jgi:hypothetical protein
MHPNPPVYDQVIKGHVITFKVPSIFSIELAAIDDEVDMSGNVTFENLIREFLSSSARYFSRPLDYEAFQKRAIHKWERDSSILFRPAEGVRYIVEWKLERGVFYANRYELCWVLQAAQPIIVCPVAPAADSSHSPVVKEVATESIPFKAASAEERDKLKRSIRHARLRIALAQLRAERLAEKYYRRYGSWEDGDGGESDSDLSVDSVAPPPAAPTAENIGSR